MSPCVCVRERERGRGRETETETERGGRETERRREGGRERETASPTHPKTEPRRLHSLHPMRPLYSLASPTHNASETAPHRIHSLPHGASPGGRHGRGRGHSAAPPPPGPRPPRLAPARPGPNAQTPPGKRAAACSALRSGSLRVSPSRSWPRYYGPPKAWALAAPAPGRDRPVWASCLVFRVDWARVPARSSKFEFPRHVVSVAREAYQRIVLHPCWTSSGRRPDIRV